ncbi:MAG: MmgE/PrpD family protein [Pyramidobacter sp.]|nr:MmgE/PrpD family protein [Pyramidobacter sp.]
MKLTERFAHFIATTNYDTIPAEAIAVAKERIMDTLGAAVAGAKTWEFRENFLAACRRHGKGGYAVFGQGVNEFPLPRAAMINATFAHVVELDDGHTNAGVHAGAAIVPLALTLGASLGCSGKEILAAVVIGYDVVYRLAAAMAPYQIQKGFHPSGNDDTIGCMAVAGKLLGLSEKQLANGLGLSALYASGLMEATVSGQSSKCIQVGNAAFNGLSAAYYAAEDMEGTLTAFEGKTGFFNAKSQDVDVDKVCEGLGEKFVIGDTYNKLYPTCRHSQPCIEAALDLAEENGIKWEDVASVWAGTHQVAYDLTGVIKEPKNAAEAKFSIAYGIALALHEHRFGMAQLEEKFTSDPVNRELAQKVTVVVDPEVQAVYPKKRGARVKITLKDGREFAKELYDLKGSPNAPIGWAELEKKYRGNVEGIFDDAEANRALELIQGMDSLEGVSELMAILNKKR